MKFRNGRIIFAGMLAFLFLYGCAAVSESFKVGKEMSQAGRWDDAVVYFEKALNDDPDKQEYKDAFVKAKQEAAKVHYDNARRMLASAPDPDMLTLQQIFKEIDAAFKLDQNNYNITSLYHTIKEKTASIQDMIKSLYSQADMDIQQEDWVSAVTKLKQINNLSPGYRETGDKLARAEREGARIYYQHGIAMAKQEDWRMAAQAFKAALDLNPNYYDAANLYKDAKLKDRADYFLSEAEKALRANNLERTILMYEKAKEYAPGNMELAKKLDGLKAKAGQTYVEEAQKLFKQGSLNKALKKMELIKNYNADIENDPLFKEFSKNLSAKLIERADKYAEQELRGNGLIWYQKAEALNPNHPDLFQKILDTKDYINKRIKKSIAVFDFAGPKNNEDAGKIVANKLIAYLHRNASGDIRIIERENLQSILREMQLGQTGIVDTKTVQTLGKMKGIDTFIMGNVLHFLTTKGDTPSTNQVKVLVDEETVRNPDFTDWLILNPKPTPEDLRNAPPRNITKKNYQFVSFKQGSAKITAMIEISYKLVDTVTGENISTNTVPGLLIKEDKYSDAVPAANIVHDPLVLPTEIEVLDELTNQKISEVAQSVLRNFQSLEVAYFDEAQQFQRRRNVDKAVEKYIDAVYDEKLKGISTPISQKSLESIENLIEDK